MLNKPVWHILGFGDPTFTQTNGMYLPTVSDYTGGLLYGIGPAGTSIDRRAAYANDLNPGSVLVKLKTMSAGSGTDGSGNPFGDLNCPTDINFENANAALLRYHRVKVVNDTSEWKISNNDNGACYITFYFIKAKHCVPSNSFLGQSLPAFFNKSWDSLKTSSNTVNQSGVTQTVFNVPTSTAMNVCCDETMTGIESNKLFMKYFKLYKVKKILLNAGETVTTKLSKKNYWVNSFYMRTRYNSGDDFDICETGMRYIFMKVEGTLGHGKKAGVAETDNANMKVERSTVLTGNFAMLDIMHTKTFEIQTPIFKPVTYLRKSLLNSAAYDGVGAVTPVFERVNKEEPAVDVEMGDHRE